MVNVSKYEVNVRELRWNCNPKEFEFKDTSQLKESGKLEDIIKGQEIAKKQLKDAIRLRQNAILVDPPGCGKSLLANKLAEQYSAELQDEIQLTDQVLTYNFNDSFEPLALSLPTPKGSELQTDLNQLVNDIKNGRITKEKLSEENINEIKKSSKELEEQKKYIYKFLEKIKKSNGNFKFQVKPPEDIEDWIKSFFNSGMIPHVGTISMSKEQVQKIAERDIYRTETEIKRLENLLKQQRPEYLIEKYKAYPKVKEFLERAVQDLTENFPEPPMMPQLIMQRQEDQEKELEKYKVNLVVNNSKTKGLPVQFIQNPNIQNMVGDVQHDPYGLGGRKPHMRAKAGKLPRANGGIVIIDELITVFKNPILTDYLLTALEERKVRIGGGYGLIGGGSSAGIETEPLDANCIIIGCANEDIRRYTTDKMARRFKHKILFDNNMSNTKENRMAYAYFIVHEVSDYNKNPSNREKIPHFSREGVAAIIEEGARFATRFGNANKEKYLTNILDAMKDVVQKAGLKALDDHSLVVKNKHVKQALVDIRTPAIKEQINYAEKVKDGTIILHTQDKEVGYVNGLVVYADPFKTEYFGFPARLEAIVSAGKRGLVSTTENSKLSGEVFTKSFEVIIGYFKQKYEQNAPQYYEARLDFNQLYNPLEGDSASIATTVAYLSAFSNIGVIQSKAVTGSMNQRGNIQAVGGVNEKIEGFYRVCKEQGLFDKKNKENYGVIIPKSNVQSLMLNEELIKDIKDGKFHIYAVSTLDEALEILTNTKAEKLHEKVKEKMSLYSKGYQRETKIDETK
ncbi:MAG: AAA family ATPase [Candidatus Pacearchaeota archaeon]|nr:AAA family ATPase [Candidatus Pacearchaeota archaeon]